MINECHHKMIAGYFKYIFFNNIYFYIYILTYDLLYNYRICNQIIQQAYYSLIHLLN